MENEKQNFTIKNWAEEDRPREKMLLKGARSLSNAELLAILIGSGNAEMTAVDLSKKILNDVENNLQELGRKSIQQLIAQYKGIGEAKAITILAAMELGRRRQTEKALERPQITGSHSVAELFFPLLADLNHEEFWILYLNRNNKVISTEKISQGGVDATVVDVKIIFKRALELLASSIILCHNHPSGNLEPSSHDISITENCKKAGDALGIRVLDHIIIAANNYKSFADDRIIF